MLGITHLVLYKYWILGIVPQALQIIEEFSEIQCCYLGTEKELATLFSTSFVSYKNSFSVNGRLDIGGLLFPLR